jgi:hypothetical protein
LFISLVVGDHASRNAVTADAAGQFYARAKGTAAFFLCLGPAPAGIRSYTDKARGIPVLWERFTGFPVFIHLP